MVIILEKNILRAFSTETSFLTKSDSELNDDIYIFSFSDNILINFSFNFALKVTSVHVYLLGN